MVVNCAGQWAKALGRAARRDRAAALRRALLRGDRRRRRACTRTCRSCATRTAGPTSRRRSAAWWSAASSPRPSRGGRPDDLPHPFEFQLLEEDWEHFSVLMDEAVRRVPALAETGIRKFYNGPESFTPGQPVRDGGGARAAAATSSAPGFNSVGIASAGGAGPGAGRVGRRGRADRPTWSAVDIRRFAPFHGNNRLAARRGSPRCSGLHYAVPWPNREMRDRPGRSAARRCTTGWPRAGASFGSKMGWERPNFFAPAGESTELGLLLGQAAVAGRGRRPSSAPPARRSRSSTRRRSRSTSSTGRARSTALQWVCADDVDVAARAGASTRRCSTRAGTYESDLTVTRVGAHGVPAGQQLGHHGPRPGLDPPAPPGRAATPGSATSPRRTPCSG